MATTHTAVVISDDSDDGYETASFSMLESNNMSIPRSLIQLKGIERRAKQADTSSGGSSLVQRVYRQHTLKPSPMSSDGSPSSRETGSTRPLELLNNRRAGLHSLPSELLAKVCENLEPVWIYNLSHTCGRLFHRLNGPHANLIWYNALPPILWAKGEKFQHEGELRDWMIDAMNSPIPITKKCDKIDADDEVHMIPMTPNSKLAKAKSISTPEKKPEKRPSPAKINTKVAQEWPVTHGPDTSVPNSADMGYMYGPYISPSEDEATWLGGADSSDDGWSSMPSHVLDKLDPMDLDQPSWPEAFYPNDRIISSDTHMHGAPPPALIRSAPPHAYHVDRMTEPPADIRRALSPVQLERLWPSAKRQRVSTTQGTDGHMTVSVFNLPERKQVKALGGPYQAIFNYKREIMGRLEPLKRCFVCLQYGCFLKRVPVAHEYWGIRWCDDCLGQYTISLRSLEALVRDLQREVRLPYQVVRYPYATHNRKCLASGKVRMFRVETDVFFASLGYISTNFATEQRERIRIASLQAPDKRLKANTLEMRCQYRGLVVKAAQMMWEGIDPDPDQTASGVDIPRQQFHTAAFASFRERFAPTHKLGAFLFPAYLLPEGTVPKLAPGEKPKSGYLPDPFQNLVMKSRKPSLRDLSDIAEDMLLNLTEYRHPRYDAPGYGGFCTAWTDAAENWHVERIAAKQANGSTVYDWHSYMKKNKELSLSLSQKLDFDELAPLVDRMSLTVPLTTKDLSSSIAVHASTEELIREEQHLKHAEFARRTKIAAFHKIAFETCKRCPNSGLLLQAKGIKALLEHMRQAHRRTYWETDDFGIVG